MYKSLKAQTLHYWARPHAEIPPRPLDAPAAWRGEDMRKREDLWIYPLSDAEIAELDAAQHVATGSGKPLAAMTRADFPLPALARRIDGWRDEIRRGRGFVLIRGIPVDRWSEQQAETF